MNDNDTIKLHKAIEGLKVGYTKYKQKYKAISNILHEKLYFKIDGLKLRKNRLTRLLNNSTDPKRKQEIQAFLKIISEEIEDLESIYEMCVETENNTH